MAASLHSLFARLIPVPPAEAVLVRMAQKQMLRWWLRLSWWIIPLYLALCFLNQTLFLMNPGAPLHRFQQTQYHNYAELAFNISGLPIYALPLLLWLLAIRRSEKVSMQLFEDFAAPRYGGLRSARFQIYVLQSIPVLLLMELSSLTRLYVGLVNFTQSGSWLITFHQTHLLLEVTRHFYAHLPQWILGVFYCWISAMLISGWRIWLWHFVVVASWIGTRFITNVSDDTYVWPEWAYAFGALAGLVLLVICISEIARGRGQKGYKLALFMLMTGVLTMYIYPLFVACKALPRWLSPPLVAFSALSNWPGVGALAYVHEYSSATRSFSGVYGLTLQPFNWAVLPVGEWVIPFTVLEQLLIALFFYTLLVRLAMRFDQRDVAEEPEHPSEPLPGHALEVPPLAQAADDLASP